MCDICYDYYVNEEIVTLPCHHYFCCTCIEGHLAAAITVSDFGKLRCPDAGCRIKIEEDTLKQIASPEIYSKYLEFAKN